MYTHILTNKFTDYVRLKRFHNTQYKTNCHVDANTDDVIDYKWQRNGKPLVIDEEIEISQFDLLAQSTYSHKNVYITGNL